MLMTACTGNTPEEPQLVIEEPWARAAAMINADMGIEGESGSMHSGGGTSAIYMKIRNSGRQADKLITAKTDVAEIVETHISEERDGVMMMAKVDGIDIPGRDTVELQPGGLHIMLINLQQDLIAGEQINLTLEFEKTGVVNIKIPVKSP